MKPKPTRCLWSLSLSPHNHSDLVVIMIICEQNKKKQTANTINEISAILQKNNENDIQN